MADKLCHFQDTLSLRDFKRTGMDPVMRGLVEVVGVRERLQQSQQRK